MRLVILFAFIITIAITTSCAQPLKLRNKVRGRLYGPVGTPYDNMYDYMSSPYPLPGPQGQTLHASTLDNSYGSSAHTVSSHGVRKQRIDIRPNLNYASGPVQLHNVASTATSWPDKDNSNPVITDQHLAVAQYGAASFGPQLVSKSHWGFKNDLSNSPFDSSDESAAVSAASSTSASVASASSASASSASASVGSASSASASSASESSVSNSLWRHKINSHILGLKRPVDPYFDLAWGTK